MNKKYLYYAATLFSVFLITFLIITFTRPTTSKSIFTNTVPFIKKNTSFVPTITQPVFQSTGTPPQTNMQKVTAQIDDETSKIEKDKLVQALPIRIENFKTSTSLSTTINVFTLPTDPSQSLRIEIYGVNFNNLNISSTDAIAFKDSFIEIKKVLLSRKVNLKNLQIIYGNRQYIQDTATAWVNSFKLLD